MESGPLSSEEFSRFRKDLVTFCHITSNIEGEPHADLLAQKGGDSGWPFVCFMDADGNVLARVDGGTMKNSGMSAFESAMDDEVKPYLDLQKRSAKGDKKLAAAFFMRRFELGHFGDVDLEKGLKQQALDSSQREEVRLRLVEMRTNAILEGVDMGKPETFGPLAKKLLAQNQELGLPEGPDGMKPWYVILEDAWLRKDAKTFEMAFTALRAAGARSKSFVEKRTKQLEELKKGAK